MPSKPDVPGTLERATLADLDAIVAVEQRAAAHPWSREVFAEEFARDFARIMVVRDGAIASFVVYWIVADELSILDVATDPDFRRRGHADRLVTFTIAEARSSACTRIFLEVRSHNLGAQALYEKHGFRPIGLRAGYYADTHEDAIVMERTVE